MKKSKKKQNKQPTVTIGNREISCVLIKSPFVNVPQPTLRFDAKTNMLSSSSSDTPVQVDDFDIADLLPLNGEFEAIGGGFYVSNAQTFVSAFMQKDRTLILTKEYGGNKLKDDRNQQSIDKAYKQLEAVVVDKQEKRTDQQTPNRNQQQSYFKPKSSHSNSNTPTAPAVTIKAVQDEGANPALRVQASKMIKTIDQSLLKSINNMEENTSLDMMLQILETGIEKLIAENKSLKVKLEEAQMRQTSTQVNKPLPVHSTMIDERPSIPDAKPQVETLTELTPPVEVKEQKRPECQENAIFKAMMVVEELNKGEYVINCADRQPYDDHLKEQMEELQKEFENVVAIDEDDAKKQIKELLRNELNIKNVLYKLSCYAAYCKWEPMTRPRPEGLYLVPDRVNSIYEQVTTLLEAFGFEQKLPKLFDDVISDGDYDDATGQAVSELASMFGPEFDDYKKPDSPDLITDIAELGFSEDGKIVKKTKVLL